jgi:hypothetical protein
MCACVTASSTFGLFRLCRGVFIEHLRSRVTRARSLLVPCSTDDLGFELLAIRASQHERFAVDAGLDGITNYKVSRLLTGDPEQRS